MKRDGIKTTHLQRIANIPDGDFAPFVVIVVIVGDVVGRRHHRQELVAAAVAASVPRKKTGFGVGVVGIGEVAASGKRDAVAEAGGNRDEPEQLTVAKDLLQKDIFLHQDPA